MDTMMSNVDMTAGAAAAAGNAVSSFSAGLSAAAAENPIDMSDFGMDAETLSADMTAKGTESAAAFTSGMNEQFSLGTADMETAMSAAMTSMGDSVSAGGQSMEMTVSTAMSNIQTAVSSVDLAPSGTNLMQGLINGMASMQGQVEAKARQIARAAATAVNSELKIHSPSKVGEDSGENLDRGFILGMANKTGEVEKTASDVAGSAEKGFSFKGITESLAGMVRGTPGTNRTDRAEGEKIVYSPVNHYHFSGAADRNEIAQAERQSQREFEKMMDAWMRKKQRVSFA